MADDDREAGRLQITEVSFLAGRGQRWFVYSVPAYGISVGGYQGYLGVFWCDQDPGQDRDRRG